MSRIIFNLTIVTGALAWVPSLWAQPITLDTAVGVTSFATDRYIIGSPDTESVGYIYRPSMEMAYQGETLSTALNMSADYLAHITSDLPDRTSFDIGWQGAHLGEVSSTQLTIGYDEGLVEELIELNDSTAVISSDAQVRTVTIRPFYERRISETISAFVDYTFGFSRLVSQEQQGVSFNQQGQDNHSLDISLTRQFSPRNNLGLQLNYLKYEPNDESDSSEKAELLGASLVSNYQHSEKFRFEGAIGAVQLQTAAGEDSPRFETVSDGSTNLTANFGLYFIGLRNNFALDGSVGTNQQLDGVLDLQQTLDLFLSRRHNSFLESRLGIGYFHGDRIDRETFSVETGLAWNWSQNTSLDLSYRYFQQTQDVDQIIDPLASDEVSDVSANRVTITLSYKFDQIRF